MKTTELIVLLSILAIVALTGVSLFQSYRGRVEYDAKLLACVGEERVFACAKAERPEVCMRYLRAVAEHTCEVVR